MATRTLFPLFCGLLLAAGGCPALDAGQPIALVPDDDWTAHERSILTKAAECWNMEFGTQMSVGASDSIMQQVEVKYSDFVCIYAAGRTEVTLPVSVHICPSKYFFDNHTSKTGFFFSVLTHELGHVLNIRPHADDPGSVMSQGDLHDYGYIPESFSDEDHALFEAWNEGFEGVQKCRVKISEIVQPGCSC
jgi:hypothetical protein